MHLPSAILRTVFHPYGIRSSHSRRWLSARVRFGVGGGYSVEVDEDDHTAAPPGPGRVAVKLRGAPCTPADLRTLAAGEPRPSSKSHPSTVKFPCIGGNEGLWEVTAVGENVSTLRPGDLAVPVAGNAAGDDPQNGETGTWRTTAILAEASLVKVPNGDCGAGGRRTGGGGGAVAAAQNAGDGGRGFGVDVGLEVIAHCSGSVATAIRILEDFVEKELGAGDRVVLTGASSAVAQILLQLAASRGLESVCLVNSEEEAALALRLGAWKATLLKEFKAMRMDNAYIVADGEGGVLGFTAARSLRFRGCFISYADLSGGGVSLPVAGQIFADTKCRGFSLPRWASTRPVSERKELVERSLEVAASVGLRLEGVKDFPLREAELAIGAMGETGWPVLFRGCR